jgi:dipeptidyl aminopeptidase/acylaminoacyl peptidase
VAPRWSPSGALAFASDRDHPGRMALYVLDSGPGEARPLGDVPGSVEDHRWSPDGSALLVLAADLGADRAGIEAATKIQERDAPDADPKVTRPFEAWRRLYRIDAESGETAEVGPPGVHVFELDWDGADRAVAVCAEEPTESAWYTAHLALLDLEAKTAEVVHRPDFQLQSPCFAGDGDTVCFVEGFCSDRGVLAGPVFALDLTTRAMRPLAPALDAVSLRARDGSSIWFAGLRGTETVCGTISLEGAVEEVWAGEATLGQRFRPYVTPGPGVVASVLESPGEAPEVVVMDAALPGSWRRVSELNGNAPRPLDTVAFELVRWTAADGLEIEGILVRRRQASEPLPLVVYVHGGPTGAWSHHYMSLPTMLAAEGYAVLLPNPRGSAGRGQAFARANLGDMGGGDLADILAGIDTLVDDGVADADRVGITGGSYGGYMAAWAVTQSDRFRASVPMACVSDWRSFHLTTNIGRFDELFLNADPFEVGGEYDARSPVVQAKRCRTPTLILHGEDDLCTPIGQAEELYQALVEAGVEAELVVYPREGHGFFERDHVLDMWERTRAWFDRHLKSADI